MPATVWISITISPTLISQDRKKDPRFTGPKGSSQLNEFEESRKSLLSFFIDYPSQSNNYNYHYNSWNFSVYSLRSYHWFSVYIVQHQDEANLFKAINCLLYPHPKSHRLNHYMITCLFISKYGITCDYDFCYNRRLNMLEKLTAGRIVEDLMPNIQGKLLQLIRRSRKRKKKQKKLAFLLKLPVQRRLV